MKCVGIVKKTGLVCGCKARYKGLYCGRHKGQSGGVSVDFVPELIDCFVCCGERVEAVIMPCCGQKLCHSCTIKNHLYSNTCAFCRHKLEIGLNIVVKKC